jgi:hypothetical protein
MRFLAVSSNNVLNSNDLQNLPTDMLLCDFCGSQLLEFSPILSTSAVLIQQFQLVTRTLIFQPLQTYDSLVFFGRPLFHINTRRFLLC